jgi:hypothetical protein
MVCPIERPMVETIKQIGAGEEVIGGLQIGW